MHACMHCISYTAVNGQKGRALILHGVQFWDLFFDQTAYFDTPIPNFFSLTS